MGNLRWLAHVKLNAPVKKSILVQVEIVTATRGGVKTAWGSRNEKKHYGLWVWLDGGNYVDKD